MFSTELKQNIVIHAMLLVSFSLCLNDPIIEITTHNQLQHLEDTMVDQIDLGRAQDCKT